MPELSVVIATYNANATLGLQLEALARQRDAPPFEVIVVDNASTESPVGVVSDFSGELDVRVVRAEATQGVAYARNVGLAAARAEKIIFCDADDCAAPSFLRTAAEGLADAPFLTGNVRTVTAADFARGYEAVQAEIDRSVRLDGPTSGRPALMPVDETYPIFMGGASAVRRDAAMAIGGFDQSYVPGAEDNDFGLRVIAAGHPLMHCSPMLLAERRRATPRGAFRRSFEGGKMHMRLCSGHDLWGRSPHLRNPVWWQDLLRLPLAAARVVSGGGGSEEWYLYAGRVGLRVGQLVGFVTYRVLRRPVVPMLGLGFDEGLLQRG